ncbi:MAG: transposase [Clostridia bacterium]|nr:transposase [Clostridia bacterium]
MAYPEWVEKHRRKGTNISCIRGKYYLYECTSKYDPEKKRAKKITGKYLGRITEEGLIPPKEKKPVNVESVSVKEYGASEAVSILGQDVFNALQKHFPNEAERLFSMAVIRLIERCPFKRIEEAYLNSFLSEKFGKLALSSGSISNFLKEFGKNREKIAAFLREFIGSSEYVLFDGTNIISNSKEMDINRLGYNSHREYDPQINLMMAFSADRHSPSYYRIVPGNVKDVTAFKQSVIESGIGNMTVIADKGFGSKENFDMLEEAGLKYIVPLRRNNGMINKDKLRLGNKNAFNGYFLYRERVIWYYSYRIENKNISVYLDSDLRNREEKDYAQRIAKGLEGFSNEGFMDKQFDFGTIALCSNIDESPEKLYSLYKTRGEIETGFDFLKNLLEQDKTYLQSSYAVEAWAFINHISLMLIYSIYNRLRQANALSKYSVDDFIQHLKYIRKAKINSAWFTGEITAKTKALLRVVNMDIT